MGGRLRRVVAGRGEAGGAAAAHRPHLHLRAARARGRGGPGRRRERQPAGLVPARARRARRAARLAPPQLQGARGLRARVRGRALRQRGARAARVDRDRRALRRGGRRDGQLAADAAQRAGRRLRRAVVRGARGRHGWRDGRADAPAVDGLRDGARGGRLPARLRRQGRRAVGLLPRRRLPLLRRRRGPRPPRLPRPAAAVGTHAQARAPVARAPRPGAARLPPRARHVRVRGRLLLLLQAPARLVDALVAPRRPRRQRHPRTVAAAHRAGALRGLLGGGALPRAPARGHRARHTAAPPPRAPRARRLRLPLPGVPLRRRPRQLSGAARARAAGRARAALAALRRALLAARPAARRHHALHVRRGVDGPARLPVQDRHDRPDPRRRLRAPAARPRRRRAPRAARRAHLLRGGAPQAQAQTAPLAPPLHPPCTRVPAA